MGVFAAEKQGKSIEPQVDIQSYVLDSIQPLNAIFSGNTPISITDIEVLTDGILESMETSMKNSIDSSPSFRDYNTLQRYHILKSVRRTLPKIFDMMKNTLDGYTTEQSIHNYEKFNQNLLDMVEISLTDKLNRGAEPIETRSALKTLAVVKSSLPEISNAVRRRVTGQINPYKNAITTSAFPASTNPAVPVTYFYSVAHPYPYQFRTLV